MAWILNEDAALKWKLQGMTVTDNASRAATGKYAGGNRSVPVRFRLPEDEIAAMQYPIVVIEHVGIYPDPEREHRSVPIGLPYAPEGLPLTWNPEELDYRALPYRVPDYPIPYNLDYQVTVYSRLARDHVIPLVSQLAGPDRIPYHFGYLDIPQDGTRRYMILMAGPDLGYTKDESGKRLFTADYRIRVFSELIGPVQNLIGGYPLVSKVELDLTCYQDLTDLSLASIKESTSLLASGTQSSFKAV